MRIAQVAPLWEPVPPLTYGGTELVVHLLTEELVRRGHEVTLFAAGGTLTSARFVPCSPRPLRGMEKELRVSTTHAQVMCYELDALSQVYQQAHEFDIIHNHMGFPALPFAAMCDVPTVTTLHNAVEDGIMHQLFSRHANQHFVSISDYQRRLWPQLNYAATIYHGINLSRFTPDFSTEDKNYLVFLGRMSPEKGPHLAIDIAQALGMKLIMAGKIDRIDGDFYAREIEHRVDGQQIAYIGEVTHSQKVELLRHAAATLCPVQWPEPFGLVLIESMACGTPVFALRNGSTPEVIDQEVTGFVADTTSELIEAVRFWRDFDRQQIRRTVERRFSMERMADDHERLYEQLNRTGSAVIELPLTPTQVASARQATLMTPNSQTPPHVAEYLSKGM